MCPWFTLSQYLFVIVLDYALGTAIDGREEELVFQLERRRSRRQGPTVVTDLDFADDIALLSELSHQAQQMLSRVETSVGNVGLKIASKTKHMTFNQKDPVCLTTEENSIIEKVKRLQALRRTHPKTSKPVRQLLGATNLARYGNLHCQKD